MTERDQRRVALVMAASKGIGRACAEALAADGFRLVICARGGRDLDRAVAHLKADGADVMAIRADVSSGSDIHDLFLHCDQAFGRLDVLVCNAGGPPSGSFEDLSDESWCAAYELTLMSAVRAIREAIPRMRAGGYGRLIMIGSSSSRSPLPNLALSNVFRPALVGLVKMLAQELARDLITVNMVSPGRIATDRVRSLDEDRANRTASSYAEVRANSESRIPLGRYGTPGELASVVAFLASTKASYVTGQNILVDGGLVASIP